MRVTSASLIAVTAPGGPSAFTAVAPRGVTTGSAPNSLLTRILPVTPVSGSGSRAINAGGCGAGGVAGATRLPAQPVARIAAVANARYGALRGQQSGMRGTADR